MSRIRRAPTTIGALADGVRRMNAAPRIPKNRTSKVATRINLKAVAEVLAERGLDPTVELCDIVAPPDGSESTLPVEVRARVLNELLQYTQPKLKSVEIKGRLATTTFDVNDEQARRIAEEFLKASGSA